MIYHFVQNMKFILFAIFTFLVMNSPCAAQKSVNIWEIQQILFDYIIVGGGSGGATVAGRLSEHPEHKVLLIEAGGVPGIFSYVPGLFLLQSLGPGTWQYPIEPQTACFNSFPGHKFNYAQGKVLGGTSTINGMLYVRGNSHNFDSWADLGLSDWSFNKVLPFFLRAEGNTIPELMNDKKYHNSSGPDTVSRSRYQTQSLNYFLKGAQLNGIPLTDYNGANQSGVSRLDFTKRNGSRCSTYVAYIDTPSAKANLYLATYATVIKVLFNQNAAVGVQVLINGQLVTVRASKEVILSAGSLATPKILMHSGIGPKEQLQKFNISVLVDLPGVGENLQDHIGFISMIWKVNCSDCTYNFLGSFSLANILNYILFRQGQLTSSCGVEGVAFTSTNKSNPWPDLQLLYIATSFVNLALMQSIFTEIDLKVLNQYYAPYSSVSTSFTIAPCTTQPKSRGYVRLNSSDPTAYPIVNFNYLADQRDADVLIAGAQLAKAIGDSEAFKSIGAQFIPTAYPGCEGYPLYTYEYWNCTVRGMMYLLYHPAGTCKMGLSTDPMAVVDSQLRVVGVSKLRVSDASIMPLITSGNPMAPTIMIGERAADFILNGK